MRQYTLPLLATLLLASCGNVVGDRTTVQRVGSDQLLKLRAGPSLDYRIVLGLPDGTALNRHECVTEVGQLWCRVSLANASQISGYVSADYLTQ